MSTESPTYESKAQHIRALLRSGVNDIQQIMATTDSSQTHVYRVMKNVKEKGFPPEEMGAKPQIMAETPTEPSGPTKGPHFYYRPIEKPEDEEKPSLDKLEGEVKRILIEGHVTEPQLTAVFSMANVLLFNKYHEVHTNQLMGQTGAPVINRLADKYHVQNLDLMIFGMLMLFYVGAPLKEKLGPWLRRRRRRHEPQRENKENKG